MHLRVYDDNSNLSFSEFFKNSQKEQFIHSIVINWKEIIISLNNFKTRIDW